MSESKINFFLFLFPPTPTLHFRFSSGRSDKQTLPGRAAGSSKV